MPFDEAKADRVIKFIETHCTHTKGRWAGVRFQLIDWQRELIRELFGRVKPNGLRQYRFAYLEIPKKNGKTELSAAVGLYMLCGDDENSAEVYSCAGDREQASIVFNCAKTMVEQDKTLSSRLKVIDSRKRIVYHKRNSFYAAISSEAFTKHGTSPSCVLFDELHAQPTRELWDVMTADTDAARGQQLVFVTTTAGVYDLLKICWEVREHARQVKEGTIEDPEYLPVIYAASPEDDWESEQLWKDMNPSLDVIFDLDYIRKTYRAAKQNPAMINNFLRFRLNRWVNQITRWMPMDHWDACGMTFDQDELIKRPCYGGLDLSSTTDLTAFLLVFPPKDKGERWKVVCRFYVPEENIMERARKDRVPYDLWRRSGLITATPGNRIDHAFIRRDVVNAASIYDLREVAYDPWGAVKLANELDQEDGIAMIEHRQGWKSMSPPMKQLLAMILGHEIAHADNPVLRWCADNLVVKIDPAENVKPEKDKARERIDGVVALIMALGRAVLNQDRKSVYETRGVIAL